jgi:predicted Na+-dependent transporter
MSIDFFHLIQTIVVAQIVPLIVGLCLRKKFPQYAWVAKSIVNIGILFVSACFIFLIITHYHAFEHFRLQAYMVCILATMCAFCLGVIFSKRSMQKRLSFSIVISLRDPGMAYLIASLNFDVARVNLAMLPYITTTILTVLMCALILKKIGRWRNRSVYPSKNA